MEQYYKVCTQCTASKNDNFGLLKVFPIGLAMYFSPCLQSMYIFRSMAFTRKQFHEILNTVRTWNAENSQNSANQYHQAMIRLQRIQKSVYNCSVWYRKKVQKRNCFVFLMLNVIFRAHFKLIWFLFLHILIILLLKEKQFCSILCVNI